MYHQQQPDSGAIYHYQQPGPGTQYNPNDQSIRPTTQYASPHQTQTPQDPNAQANSHVYPQPWQQPSHPSINPGAWNPASVSQFGPPPTLSAQRLTTEAGSTPQMAGNRAPASGGLFGSIGRLAGRFENLGMKMSNNPTSNTGTPGSKVPGQGMPQAGEQWQYTPTAYGQPIPTQVAQQWPSPPAPSSFPSMNAGPSYSYPQSSYDPGVQYQPLYPQPPGSDHRFFLIPSVQQQPLGVPHFQQQHMMIGQDASGQPPFGLVTSQQQATSTTLALQASDLDATRSIDAAQDVQTVKKEIQDSGIPGSTPQNTEIILSVSVPPHVPLDAPAEPPAQTTSEDEHSEEEAVSLGEVTRQSHTPDTTILDSQASWTAIDPSTGLPSRQFLAVGNAMFDYLDAKYEPLNTGRMEHDKFVAFVALAQSDNPKFTDVDGHFYTKNNCEALVFWLGRYGIEHLLVPAGSTAAITGDLSQFQRPDPDGGNDSISSHHIAPGEEDVKAREGKPSGLWNYKIVLTRLGFLQYLYSWVYESKTPRILRACLAVLKAREEKGASSSTTTAPIVLLPDAEKLNDTLHEETFALFSRLEKGVMDELVKNYMDKPDLAGTSISPAGASGGTASGGTAGGPSNETEEAKVQQALFEARLAQMQMDATSQMGNVMKNSVGNTYRYQYRYI